MFGETFNAQYFNNHTSRNPNRKEPTGCSFIKAPYFSGIFLDQFKLIIDIFNNLSYARFMIFFKKKIFLILIISCLLIFGCSSSESENTIVTESSSFFLSEQEKGLWDNFIVPYVENVDYYDSQQLYDLCNWMLIPMNAVFLYHDQEGMTLFKDHIETLLTPSVINNFLSLKKTSINTVQYLFFLSEYCKLSQIYKNKTGDNQFIVLELVDLIESELYEIWNLPAWQWEASPFPNMKSRIDWKLTAENTENKFYKKWIIDTTFYVFGIAANLKFITRYSSQEINQSLIDDVLDSAKRVFEEGIEQQSEGGWVLQPGIPKDHPDYFYAGHEVNMPAELSEKKMSLLQQEDFKSYLIIM